MFRSSYEPCKFCGMTPPFALVVVLKSCLECILEHQFPQGIPPSKYHWSSQCGHPLSCPATVPARVAGHGYGHYSFSCRFITCTCRIETTIVRRQHTRTLTPVLLCSQLYLPYSILYRPAMYMFCGRLPGAG